MVYKKASAPNTEPASFAKPSEKEHLFQVADIFDSDSPGKFNLGPDDVVVKLEVADGPELGRSLLHFMTVDHTAEAFFKTRIFLKAIREPYKGDDFPINSSNWQAKQFYADAVHSFNEKTKKTYAKLGEPNYEKTFAVVAPVQDSSNPDGVTSPDDIKWSE